MYISTFQVWIYTFVHIHIFSARLCIYTPYTHFWKWSLEICFFSYSFFSAPQAPPNAILRSLFAFPLLSERSGIVLGWFCDIIPSIHIWICEYTHLCIYTLFRPICAYRPGILGQHRFPRKKFEIRPNHFSKNPFLFHQNSLSPMTRNDALILR